MGIVFHHEEITVEENRQRNEYLRRYYNPETGEGSDTGDRRILRLPDAPIPVQYIPKALFENEIMAQRLVECGSLAVYAERYGHDKIIATDEAGRNPKLADGGDATEELWREWIRVRIRYDFEFWAFSFVRIKDKLGAEDIPFRLNRPQRRILGMLEDMRTAGKPIRLILLKARQWGGSTLVQIYMAWIQLVHCRNWNSVICAHLKESAANIKGMYSKLLANYPDWLLGGEKPKFKPFERMANTSVIAGRECRVTIGSAESQESVRGIDAAMAHLSEVAFWRNSRMKSPEQVMRSICGSIMLLPCSMVVMESTANGTGSYFHQECERAKRGESDKQFAFVPWFEIEMYTLPIDDYDSFIGIVTRMMPVFVAGWGVFGIQMGAQCALVGMGQAKQSVFLAIFRKIIMLVPLALTLPHWIGVTGIFLAEPISDATSGIVAGILFYVTYRSLTRGRIADDAKNR